jgi:hypothetical protein
MASFPFRFYNTQRSALLCHCDSPDDQLGIPKERMDVRAEGPVDHYPHDDPAESGEHWHIDLSCFVMPLAGRVPRSLASTLGQTTGIGRGTGFDHAQFLEP